MSRHRGILPSGDCSTVGLSTGVVGSSTAVIGSRLPKPLLINQVGTHGSPEWVPEGLINSGLGARASGEHESEAAGGVERTPPNPC
jgi:hypothetical protein